MGSLSIVNSVELIQLRLEFCERVTQGLFIEPSEQGLMEALVFALCGRLVWFTGDRFDAQGCDIGHELPVSATPGRVQGETIVREQPARHAVTIDSCFDHPHSCFCGLRFCGQRRDCESGMIVLYLKDHAFASPGEDILGRIDLPAVIGVWVHEPAPG